MAAPQSGKLVVDKEGNQMAAVSPPVSNQRAKEARENPRLYVAMAHTGIAGVILFANALGLMIALFYVRRLMRRIMVIAQGYAVAEH